MPATRYQNLRTGALLIGAAFGVAVASMTVAANAQSLEQYFRSQSLSNRDRGVRAQPRYQPGNDSRQQRTHTPLPAQTTPTLDPEDVALDLPKPDRPRPKGSDARVCTNQEKDLAVYRIQSCGAVISSGKLQGEALGVAYELRGLAHLDRNDVAHAIGDLNRAVDLAPEFAPAYQNRGNAWYARGNFGQALADYDKAIALDPHSASPYINRAAVRRDLGYREGALEDYARAVELRPNHAPTYSGRGQLYMTQKDYARATADFDQAIRFEPSADNYMLRASAREAAGDLDGALKNFKEAARLDPKNVAPLNAMASVLYQKKDYDQEIAVLTRAVPLDEKPALSYRLRAEAWLAKGDRKKAASDVSNALKYAWSVNGLRVRGNMRLEDGDADGAIADAEGILKIESDNAEAVALRGLAYARKKDYAKALPDLNKTIEADASNALAFAERGQAYIAQNDSAHALPDLSRAIDLKLPSAAPYRARAAIYKSKGDIARALADLTQAIAIDPKPAEPYRARAALLQSKGDSTGALADYDAALKRDPSNAGTYYLRGQIYERSASEDKAVADYKAALARDGKLNEARLALTAIEQRREKTRLAALEKEAAEARKTQAEAAKLESNKPDPKRPNSKQAVLKTDKSGQGKMVVVALPQAKPEMTSDAAPEVTGTIPEAAAKTVKKLERPTARTSQETKQVSKRERALREYNLRKQAARKAQRQERSARASQPQRRAQVPSDEMRDLTPSERRRLYFRALDQKARAEQRRTGREARFTDAFR